MSTVETARARGCEAALVRFKIARGTMAIPSWQRDFLFARHGDLGQPPSAPEGMARPSVSWSDFNQGARQHVADAANPGAFAASPRPPRQGPVAPHLPAPAPAASPAHVPATATAPVASRLSRFRMPSLGGAKGALGLAALGALGAGAMGLHRQHQRDLEGQRLVYAPTQGGFY